MKRTSLALAVGVALFAASGVGFAAPLDLYEAWQLAMKKDPTILASRAATAAALERVPQALAQLAPNVSVSFNRSFNDLKTVQPDILGNANTSQQEYLSASQTIGLRQPLYRPYQAAAYQQSKYVADEANFSLARDTQNVAVRVGGAFLEALLAEDQLKLIQAQKQAYATQHEASQKALLAGAGTRTDVDESRARLDLAVAQELEAEQNVAYTRKQLEILIDEPVTELAHFNPASFALIPPNPATLDAWVQKAEASSPELQTLVAQSEQARLELEKAEAGHKPTLDLVAQRSRSVSENVTRVNTTFDNISFGLQLSVPIYSGGYVDSTVRQAVANLERARQALEAGRRDLSSRVYKEFRGVTEGILRVKAYEQAVKSAELLITSNRKSFQGGSRTIVDVLNAEQQKMVSMRDLAQARYSYLISKLRLTALAGEVNEEAMRSLNVALTPVAAQ